MYALRTALERLVSKIAWVSWTGIILLFLPIPYWNPQHPRNQGGTNMQILRRGAGGWVFFTYKISISIMILNGWYLMLGLWFLKSTEILIRWCHFTISKFKKYIFINNDNFTNFTKFTISIIILSYCVVIITSTFIQTYVNFLFLSWLLF